MALQQRPPLSITKIQWPAGDWIVISVKIKRTAWNGSFALKGWDPYNQNPLKLFPSDASKPSSYKAPGLKGDHPEPEWRGHLEDYPEPTGEDDSGTPPYSGSNDEFTWLYFLNNEKPKDGEREPKEVKLTFPKLSVAKSSSGVAYYVWPDDNGDPTRPYFPEPTKEQALGPPPESQWPYLGGPEYAQNGIWISYYNSEFSWYETWSPGLRWQMGNQIGFAAFDALHKPDGPNWGWDNQADRDAFLAAWAQFVAPSQTAQGAFHDFWPLPYYHALEFDWSHDIDPNAPKAREDVTIDAYRIKRNNIVFDNNNALKGKLPDAGKDYATYEFSHQAPVEKREITVTWNSQDGIKING